ncbi:hypothetical protein [Lysobacter gummosus]|uniref:hypothetical protein n=1 Tax=Lysobacter gummosus TaxID=262324 RepID=UPI00362BEB52
MVPARRRRAQARAGQPARDAGTSARSERRSGGLNRRGDGGGRSPAAVVFEATAGAWGRPGWRAAKRRGRCPRRDGSTVPAYATVAARHGGGPRLV